MDWKYIFVNEIYKLFLLLTLFWTTSEDIASFCWWTRLSDGALLFLSFLLGKILSFQSDLSASVLLDYEVSSDYFSDAFDGFGEVNLASLSDLGNVLISVTTFFKVII